MLVISGHFARAIGLVSALLQVPIPQKTVHHSPQTKLLQLLVATLAGTAHLREMADGPHPLVSDQAVAAAWDQPGWADPSGVSRTLRAATDATVADNAALAAPVRIVIRIDAGFSSGANLAWLIELGYEVLTKAHNAQVTRRLRATKPDDAPWVRVGDNAEVWVQPAVRITNCPYPLDAALKRFHTGPTVRHGTLLHSSDTPVVDDPAG